MTTLHHPNVGNRSDPRPAFRCFRHHVWMAYCDDCRRAHAPLLRKGRQSGAGQR